MCSTAREIITIRVLDVMSHVTHIVKDSMTPATHFAIGATLESGQLFLFADSEEAYLSILIPLKVSSPKPLIPRSSKS